MLTPEGLDENNTNPASVNETSSLGGADKHNLFSPAKEIG